MSWCKYTIQLIPLSVSCLLIPFMYFLYIFKLNTNLQMFPEICCFKWCVVSIFPNRKSILVKLISTESILLLCGIDHFCVGIMLVFVQNRIRVSAWARLLACTSSYYHLLICCKCLLAHRMKLSAPYYTFASIMTLPIFRRLLVAKEGT